MTLEPDTYDMPFYWRISGGLRPESTVVLAGLIPEQSKRFYVQFANGQYDRAKALRLEAHFDDSPYMAIVTLNCFEDRPRIKESPLKPGRRFTIKINVTRNSYKYLAFHFMADLARPDEVTFMSDLALITNEFDISDLEELVGCWVTQDAEKDKSCGTLVHYPCAPSGTIVPETAKEWQHYRIFKPIWIFANGRFLDEFPHCFPPKDAIFLEMDGDVMLEELKFLSPHPAGH